MAQRRTDMKGRETQVLLQLSASKHTGTSTAQLTANFHYCHHRHICKLDHIIWFGFGFGEGKEIVLNPEFLDLWGLQEWHFNIFRSGFWFPLQQQQSSSTNPIYISIHIIPLEPITNYNVSRPLHLSYILSLSKGVLYYSTHVYTYTRPATILTNQTNKQTNERASAQNQPTLTDTRWRSKSKSKEHETNDDEDF